MNVSFVPRCQPLMSNQYLCWTRMKMRPRIWVVTRAEIQIDLFANSQSSSQPIYSIAEKLVEKQVSQFLPICPPGG